MKGQTNSQGKFVLNTCLFSFLLTIAKMVTAHFQRLWRLRCGFNYDSKLPFFLKVYTKELHCYSDVLKLH